MGWMKKLVRREISDNAKGSSVADTEEVREKIVEALRTVKDPELPVNIYDLGLIYGLDISEHGEVHVRMTLTAPACPVAGILPGQVEQTILAVPGINAAQVELVWDPPWNADLMSDEARLEMGLL